MKLKLSIALFTAFLGLGLPLSRPHRPTQRGVCDHYGGHHGA
jgi:hypothetical protein